MSKTKQTRRRRKPRSQKRDRVKSEGQEREVARFLDVVAELKKAGEGPTDSDGARVTVRCEASPSELVGKENALNWKKHTQRQLDYVGESIDERGWARNLLYCANTDRILDGHGRLKDAVERDRKSVPVDVGWWTEEEGDELLASLDPTSNMASVDGNALSSLTELNLKRRLKESKGRASKTVEMMRDINSHANSVAERLRDQIAIRQSKKSVRKIIGDTSKTKRDKRTADTDHHDMYHVELREEVTFPSQSNDLGIPDLLPSKLWTNLDLLPTDTFDRSNNSLLHDFYYCEGSRPFDSDRHQKPEGGFLGFHCEDKLFEKYYKKPAENAERLIDDQWYAIVEPDYSTYWDWPFAKRLWSVFRARWCCRYWQELGQTIIPLIRRSNDLERDTWLYSSLPEKIPVGQMQLRMGGKKNFNDPNYWNGIGAVLDFCVEHNGLEMILFYGGKNLEKYVKGKLPGKLQYRFITPFINKRRKRRSK